MRAQPIHAVTVAVVFQLVIGLTATRDVVAGEIRVNCSKPDGRIRPLHGVNGGPLCDGETVDLSAEWRSLGIPLTRLHDCEWPLPDVVDMHAVFRDPTADPQSPDSYDFALTDAYIQAIRDTGARIVYRLGESIEHTRHKQYVHPPADPQRWAEACLGIIRHYNEGWADGFHHDIRYWEIWNEPENRPAMWSGTDEQYYRLYATAAKTIKAAYPALQVGGPAVGAPGELDGERLQATPFVEGLLRHCRMQQAPLDFFSWHIYTDDPQLVVRKARAIRRWLDDRSFAATKIHLNEWNYLPNNDWSGMLAPGNAPHRQSWFEAIGGPTGAAFTASVLIGLQDSPVDVANYYAGDTNPFSMFSRHGVPKKTFYAMRAFRLLLNTPVRVATSGSHPGQSAVCAGVDQERNCVTVLVANYRADDTQFDVIVDAVPWKSSTAWKTWRVDATRDLEPSETGKAPPGVWRQTYRVPTPGLLVIQLHGET